MSAPFRTGDIFLSYPTLKALKMIAKAQELKCHDELAEQILADWLAQHHPNVLEHLKARAEVEDDFAKALHDKLKPTHENHRTPHFPSEVL